MRGRVGTVVILMACALVAATVWVPKRLHCRLRVEQFSSEYLASQLRSVEAADYSPEDRPRARAMLAGAWIVNAGGGAAQDNAFADCPDRFCWIWETRSRSEAAFDGEDRVTWSRVFAAHTLILLLGGGLLTFLVRRDRRARTSPPWREAAERAPPA